LRANASNRCRRARLITDPSGYWCDGVTKISRGAGWLLRRHHAGLIDPQWADIHVVHPQNIADPPIARFFNPRVVARIAQHARHQIYRLMNAFGNQNLLRRAAHRARHAQIVHQCMLQLRAAALITVG